MKARLRGLSVLSFDTSRAFLHLPIRDSAFVRSPPEAGCEPEGL